MKFGLADVAQWLRVAPMNQELQFSSIPGLQTQSQ